MSNPSSDSQSPSCSGKPGLTVLVIDDEPLVRSVTRMFLSKSGFTVVEAGSGREGIDKAIGAPPFHAIVSDLHLSDMPGDHVVQAVKQHHPKAGIVFVSGAPPQDPSVLAPPAFFLGKPYDMKALVSTVERAIAAAG